MVTDEAVSTGNQPQSRTPLDREWLRVTLASIGDAVITTDAKANVTFLNPLAETLTGWSLEPRPGNRP